ncbi:35193_t:CDS:2, partial [Racocetra persica]
MASDVYSFGIIAYEIVSGLLAYQGISTHINLLHEINNGKRPIIPTYVPKLIAKLINKCLSSQSEERPTSKNIYETINICSKCLSSQLEERTISKELYEIISIWSNEIVNTEPTEFIAQVKQADEIIVNNLESKLPKSEEIYVSEKLTIRTSLNLINSNKLSYIDPKNSGSLLIIDQFQTNLIEMTKNTNKMSDYNICRQTTANIGYQNGMSSGSLIMDQLHDQSQTN